MIQNETDAPYGAAHNATTNPDNRYLQQETVDAIANLATATASDRTSISQLTANVARLTTVLVTVNKKISVTLQAQRAIWGIRGGHNRTTRGRGAGSGAGAATGAGSCAIARTGAVVPTLAEAKDLEPPIHYCWICGPGCRHNSAKYTNPAASHIYTATKRDMQGGAEETQ